MNRPLPPSTPEGQRAFAERNRTALSVALVAGVFSLALIVFLAVNYARGRRDDPLDSDALRALKAELLQRPKDDGLKNRIRALDLQLRTEYFRRQSRTVYGAWLLLAGGAVCFLALRAAAAYRPVPPQPPSPGDELRSQARDAARARWSVALVSGFAVGLGAALFFGQYGGAPPGSEPEGGGTGAAAEPPASDEEMARNWPRFRGPNGLGISPYANVPDKWDGKTGAGILWKTKLPLPGASSPIVWEKRIFLTGGTETQREVYCLDAGSGALVWKQSVNLRTSPKAPPKVNEDTGFAAPTPATDGRRVFAIFANGDLVAYDFGGKQVWARNLGRPDNRFGHAASLLTYKNLLLVPWDQEKGAKLLALDVATGKTVWEVTRTMGSTWITPVVAPGPAGGQVITCANPNIVAYDVATGKSLWSVNVFKEGDVAPSPVYGKGLVFAASTRAAALAIKPDGQGDVTNTHVLWRAEDGLPDACSPLTDGQYLWLLMSEGVLTCYEAATGKKLYERELAETCFASPCLAGGRIIIFTKEGVAIYLSATMPTWSASSIAFTKGGIAVYVLAGPGFNELGRAALGEKVFASPAFQDGRMYVRGTAHLYCIGSSGGQPQ